MTADPPFDEAADPARLRAFIAALEADGFERVDTRTWEGPTRTSLTERGHTTSDRMSVIVRPSWPYLPPLLHVPGIVSWHADQERLCIWQAEDNSQRWATLQGLYDRIDEWAEHADESFAQTENARNPEIYWQEVVASMCWALVDLDGLLGGQGQDGQHGEFHFAEAVSSDGRRSKNVFDLRHGPFTAMTPRPEGVPEGGHVRGRWFYRASVPHPPRTRDELIAFLTDKQRDRLSRDLRDRRLLMFGLLWRNQAGIVGTMLLAARKPDGTVDYHLVVLRPKGRSALLLRAGPDAAVLQTTSVAILGAGAIGSHLAEDLTRAGVGRLLLIDPDLLWPVNLIRHAAPPGTPAGTPKALALRDHLSQYEWVDIEVTDPSESYVWQLERLREVVRSADLTIDATGHAGLAEVTATVAAATTRPYLTVALYRGGAVARVRRQAHADDTPIVQRPHLDQYPDIPPLDVEAEYVGTETGCLAQVHNAPPTSVIRAAALAADVAIDWFTDRLDEPDEVIEVLRVGDPPFDRLGRVRPEDLPLTVDLTEAAQRHLRDCAHRAMPAETGGVLIGAIVDRRPVVAEAPEIHDNDATPCSYRVPDGTTKEVVTQARSRDRRLGYVGEWHSHPSGADPSVLDVATMLAAAEDSGAPNPVLLIVHPDGEAPDDLAVYVTTPGGLKSAQICSTGDLPAEETTDQ